MSYLLNQLCGGAVRMLSKEEKGVTLDVCYTVVQTAYKKACVCVVSKELVDGERQKTPSPRSMRRAPCPLLLQPCTRRQCVLSPRLRPKVSADVLRGGRCVVYSNPPAGCSLRAQGRKRQPSGGPQCWLRVATRGPIAKYSGLRPQ
ncbi:hypothetical protein H4R20_005448, partial [Coemansia guatemalensis]